MTNITCVFDTPTCTGRSRTPSFIAQTCDIVESCQTVTFVTRVRYHVTALNTSGIIYVTVRNIRRKATVSTYKKIC